MSATLPVSLGRATPPSSEWTRCWTRKAWFRKSGIMKVTLATCLSLTPTFVRCREPTSAGRWPTFQGPPFQGSLDEAACWSSSRADPALRQRVDRAGMNLTPPTSPKPAETSESIALILFKSCRIVGCRFQEEDTHIQKDGKKDTEIHWGLLKATSKSPALYSKSGRLRLRSYTCFFEFPTLGLWECNSLVKHAIDFQVDKLSYAAVAEVRLHQAQGFGFGSDRCEAIGHPKQWRLAGCCYTLLFGWWGACWDQVS